MGKTGRWLRNILTGKKEKVKEREKEQIDHLPPPQRRSAAGASAAAPPKPVDIHIENEPKKHPLPAPASLHKATAATKIQAARKALNALKGLVKLQALDLGAEENVKIVEMDLGEYKPATRGRNSYSQQETEEYSLESSPQCYSAVVSKADRARLPFSYPKAESLYNDYPNYMANTQSSRAKVRSNSAPKQRPPEMLLDRRRPSIEGRNVPRAVRMQRSSSHVVAHYPWSVCKDVWRWLQFITPFFLQLQSLFNIPSPPPTLPSHFYHHLSDYLETTL
ncbi:protein IQ-DOMAIN 19-like [Salvia splendens]|uniref:protein IQ-DOMAIN 19-like n=1 Tax=Salvia splendens TaxID=180675 RepID=UPI001C257AC2|nr:protein IQ-DOMAIN 19-like [Salvia splendens]